MIRLGMVHHQIIGLAAAKGGFYFQQVVGAECGMRSVDKGDLLRADDGVGVIRGAVGGAHHHVKDPHIRV